MWQAVGRGGAAGVAAVGGGQGLARAGHSQLRQTHHRAQLSPSAKLGHLWENMCKKGNTKVREKKRMKSSMAE